MKHPKIAITIRGFGTLTAELYPEKAPKTVENFLSLVDSGFYSGTVFHRVIKGFMIQGGGYTEDFAEKRAAAIPGEFRANGFMANDLHHAPGVLSMARHHARGRRIPGFAVRGLRPRHRGAGDCGPYRRPAHRPPRLV